MTNAIRFLFIGCAAILLSGCVTLASKPKMQQETLADGSAVTVSTIQPTFAWGCQQISTKSYNWSRLQATGLGDGEWLLKTKAIAYANQANIKANYIYLQMPATLSKVHPGAMIVPAATAIYYQCQQINPAQSK